MRWTYAIQGQTQLEEAVISPQSFAFPLFVFFFFFCGFSGRSSPADGSSLGRFLVVFGGSEIVTIWRGLSDIDCDGGASEIIVWFGSVFGGASDAGFVTIVTEYRPFCRFRDSEQQTILMVNT